MYMQKICAAIVANLAFGSRSKQRTEPKAIMMLNLTDNYYMRCFCVIVIYEV